MRLVVCALALAGCDPWICDEPCDGEPRAMAGERADLTAAPASEAGWWAEAPVECDQGTLVVVHGAGDRAFAPSAPEGLTASAWLDGASAGLDPAWRVHERGFGLWCGGAEGVGPAFTTDDWGAADALVAHVGESLAADDAAGPAAVLVAREVVMCPQVACGW